jgi:phosphoglycolate phosphatase
MPTHSPVAIVFDLDGTLVDSAPDMHAAANRTLTAAERPGISPAETRRFIGDGVRRFVERAFAATGPALDITALDAAEATFLADYENHASDLTRPYPDVIETLTTLKRAGHRLAVCTNKPQTASERLLADLRLDGFFERVGGGDRYPVRKPDPGHLLGVLGELGVQPEAAVMVGDNENDAETARAAGVHFVLFSYGYARSPLADIPANDRLDGFADLLDLGFVQR